MLRFGAHVRVADASCAYFGRTGRIVSTVDPDVAVVEWQGVFQYAHIAQNKLASVEAFNRQKWRLISALRRSTVP